MAKKNANLGKGLEDRITKQNEWYEKQGVAVIRKIPNPWVVRRKGPHIVGANPVPSGLCDFIGTSHLVGGRSIVFDAKECKLKTRFPLKNIKPEQMDHLTETIKHGGIGFLIIDFTELNEMYYVPYEFILPYWDDAEDENNPQSIPIADIREKCTHIHDMHYMGHIRFNETADH
jgi:recombination protein U